MGEIENPVLIFRDILGNIAGWFSSFEQAWIGYAALGVVLFFVFSLGKRYLRMGGEGGNPLREAEQANKAGDFIKAAGIYEQLGEEEKAILAYKSAKAYSQIGRIYEQGRHWRQAAPYYKLAGNIEKATEMFKKAGEYLPAAEGYLATKKFSAAAEMYEKARVPKEAAHCYEKSGNLGKAASSYEQSGDLQRAAEIYETHFLKQRIEGAESSIGGTASAPLVERQAHTQQIAYRCGMLYKKLKKYRNAADIFYAGGYLKEAAEAAEEAGETLQAAQFYVSAKQFDQAAALYEKTGNMLQYHRIVAKKYQDESNLLKAAPEFEAGEDWVSAAEMYESVGDLPHAAAMYMKSGDYAHAAEVYLKTASLDAAALAFERAGRHKEAASLYQEIKQLDKAAEMYEYAKNHYKAALLFQQQEQMEKSIHCLQKVDSHSEDYYAASLLLVKLLIERGLDDAAQERLERIIAQDEISEHNIECFYQLALIYDQHNKFDKAKSLYDKILSESFSYKDVRERSLEIQHRSIGSPQVQKPALSASHDDKKGRYRILQKVGQGGMGIVYKAEDTLLKRIVAYKILSVTKEHQQGILHTFMQEAQVCAALNHPNIVTLYDTGTQGDEVFLTMEYVDGCSLREHLEKQQLSLFETFALMEQICQGIAYAHNQGVIHRDIKPANIMLAGNGTVKITDFGLARILTEATLGQTAVRGTPLYMAPEQILGERVDRQSDIYSLGCTFYRMVAGCPPFVVGDVFYHHLHTPPAPPLSHNPRIPEGLNRLILKCLEKRKADRYALAEDLLAEVESCARETQDREGG